MDLSATHRGFALPHGVDRARTGAGRGLAHAIQQLFENRSWSFYYLAGSDLVGNMLGKYVNAGHREQLAIGPPRRAISSNAKHCESTPFDVLVANSAR